MTSDDQNLIKFLLSADCQDLNEWYKNTSDEQLIYASYLMEVYGHALEDEIKESMINHQIEQMSTLTEAQAVIAMVRNQ